MLVLLHLLSCIYSDFTIVLPSLDICFVMLYCFTELHTIQLFKISHLIYLFGLIFKLL